MEEIFYVYLHIRKTNGEPFYVGKGKNKRAFSTKKRNDWWNRIVNKHDYDILFLEENLTEAEAFEKEVYWIKRIGLENLCNITTGGSGGNTITNHPDKENILKKISLANIGELNNNFGGKTCTEEWKEKQIISQSKKPLILLNTITNEEFEFKNSKDAALFLNIDSGQIRNCKRNGHKAKRIFLVKDK
jgi:CRISPR/Cas system-associated protein Cas5 (RAMP superfamily)